MVCGKKSCRQRMDASKNELKVNQMRTQVRIKDSWGCRLKLWTVGLFASQRQFSVQNTVILDFEAE